ncbi:MAG: hypothetical protein U9Q71_03710 [Pseudomonadota bacterium]|nr:hypothetical protein [Pseudomonadota bacterium]
MTAYERLRGWILDSHPRLNGEPGLSVILRHGMLAWARTCTPVLTETYPSSEPLDARRVPAPLRDDIIDVMVAMVTNVSRSVHNGALRT